MSDINKDDIIKLSKNLRKGDQITIWNSHYQLHFKGVGTSNFLIGKDKDPNKEKGLTKD